MFNTYALFLMGRNQPLALWCGQAQKAWPGSVVIDAWVAAMRATQTPA